MYLPYAVVSRVGDKNIAVGINSSPGWSIKLCDTMGSILKTTNSTPSICVDKSLNVTFRRKLPTIVITLLEYE